MSQLAGRQLRDGGIAKVDLADPILDLDVEAVYTVDSPYATQVKDQAVVLDSTAGPITVLLPTVAGIEGRLLIFKDNAGNAMTNNITITPDGVETIDGAPGSVILNTAFAMLKLRATASGWAGEGRR